MPGRPDLSFSVDISTTLDQTKTDTHRVANQPWQAGVGKIERGENGLTSERREILESCEKQEPSVLQKRMASRFRDVCLDAFGTRPKFAGKFPAADEHPKR
jgi:hypothetical protein